MRIENRIIEILSDGRFHSGEELAKLLQLSRTSVWKYLKKIQQSYGLDIHAVKGRGYRVHGGLQLLDEQKIRQVLGEEAKDMENCHVFDRIDSTNQFLLDRLETIDSSTEVCLAEMQTSGRGRRGKSWLSPFGKNLYLSIAAGINRPLADMSGLSIAIGVAIADALSELGVVGVALKWPNDIHWQQKKLAGLLIELKGEAQGPVNCVIGLGLNIHLHLQEHEQIDQPATDLSSILREHTPERNHVAGCLIRHIMAATISFENNGLGNFVENWQSYDLYLGQEVTLSSASWSQSGIYKGIDPSGALQLHTAEGLKKFNAGELSLRRTTGKPA